MVQNQMTPTYTYTQAAGVPGAVTGVPGMTGLEEYHHQVVSQAATIAGAPGEPQAAAYTMPAAVTTNGAIEQQTVRGRPLNVR